MKPNNTAIYTRPGCPYCSKIKEFYNLKGWSYREYILNENFTRDQFYKEFGSGSTFPQLVVDGQKTGGCNESISHFKSRGII